MEGVSVVSRQNEDIADTLQIREVAIATDFWTTIAVNGLWREITTWRLVIQGWLVFSQWLCLLVACSAFLTLQAGDSQVIGWCQGTMYYMGMQMSQWEGNIFGE